MSASWLCVVKGKVESYRTGDKFDPDFSNLIIPALRPMVAEDNVHAQFVEFSDGTRQLTIVSSTAPK